LAVPSCNPTCPAGKSTIFNVKIDDFPHFFFFFKSCCALIPYFWRGNGFATCWLIFGGETWQVVLELNAAPERHVQVVEARLDDSGAE
jgi:hypothetical protein